VGFEVSELVGTLFGALVGDDVGAGVGTWCLWLAKLLVLSSGLQLGVVTAA
jgi:hypothetical protein